jgi:hypothetical protein
MMEPMMMSHTSSTVTGRPRNSSEMMASVAAGLGDAEREMARRAAHADDEIPARRGARVLHQVADDLHAVVPRGFVAERRRGTGQRQIVVNRLGHVGDLDFAVAALGTTLAENAVSSPPMVTSAVMPSFSNT